MLSLGTSAQLAWMTTKLFMAISPSENIQQASPRTKEEYYVGDARQVCSITLLVGSFRQTKKVENGESGNPVKQGKAADLAVLSCRASW